MKLDDREKQILREMAENLRRRCAKAGKPASEILVFVDDQASFAQWEIPDDR